MRRHVPVKRKPGIYRSETKHGWVHEVRYKDSTGRYRFKTVGSLEDALTFQATVTVRKARGERVVPSRITVAQLADEWVAHPSRRNLAANSRQRVEIGLRLHIIPELGKKPVQSVDTDMVSAWLAGLRKHTAAPTPVKTDTPLSENSRVAVYSVLRAMLAFAANPRRGYIPSNPCDGLERGERPQSKHMVERVMTKQEVDLLREAAMPWFKTVLEVALLTGLRAGELAGLRWDDIDFKKNEISVRFQRVESGAYTPTKGEWARTIPLLPPLRRILWDHPTRFGGGAVLLGPKGSPMHQDVVSSGFITTRSRACLSDKPRRLRLHDTRHVFASALLLDGKDIQWVAKITGHRNTNTLLNTYAHVMERENRDEEASMRLADAIGEWAR